MIQDIVSEREFDSLLAETYNRPALLLKHSTRCPVSAAALREYQNLAQSETRAVLLRVLVIENRPVSQHIAAATGVRHNSPQVILLRHGAAVWDRSHYDITEEQMRQAIEKHL